MDYEEQLNTYKQHLVNYRRKVALKDFHGAIFLLQEAIKLCPVDEALPRLSELLRATRARLPIFVQLREYLWGRRA